MSEYLTGFHPEFRSAETVLSTGIHVLEMVTVFGHPLEAIVFGGSYAKGAFQPSEDVDVDFYYGAKDVKDIVGFTQAVATAAYAEKGLDLHVRTHLNRLGTAITLSNSNVFALPVLIQQIPLSNVRRVSQIHPNSPFVAINREVVDFWRLRVK